MKYLKTFDELSEKVTIEVEVGDTIYMGRFKNKKTLIKKISKDKHGMPIINNKQVVTFRTNPTKRKKKKSDQFIQYTI